MKFAGLKITVLRNAYPVYAVLGLIPATIRLGYALLTRHRERDPRAWALVPLLGVGMATYHAVGQIFHQLGHALAARLSGHPMTGVRYEYIFSYSEYPVDEPTLPPNVHIQRSLGGFAATLLMLAGIAALWSRVRRITHWFPRWLYGFVAFDTVIFIIGGIMSDVMYVVEKGWLPKDEETPSS
jgi:hypothetical protein